MEVDTTCDFSTQQNKKALIERIKGIKFARSEINSKNVTNTSHPKSINKNEKK